MTATLYLTVGLPGSGKTTRARAVEERSGAIRLTPDEWLIGLFGGREPAGARDALEGRFITLAERLLAQGQSVILDFGLWSADERWALRDLARGCSADCVLLVAEASGTARRRRARDRFAVDPGRELEMSEHDHLAAEQVYQPPTAAELDARDLPSPPAGYPSWQAWTGVRWRLAPR